MSSAIHTLKILLLQTQFDEIDASEFQQLQVFGDFVACFYAPNWFQAPVPREAAVSDSNYIKKSLIQA